MALVRHAGSRQDRVHGSRRRSGARSCARPPRTVKRVSVELGGKSPNIVFADADQDAAMRGAFNGIFYNKGEVCAAGSRLFVEKSIHDGFVAQLAERTDAVVLGDPRDKGTRMGPVISAGQMDTVLGLHRLRKKRRRTARRRRTSCLRDQRGPAGIS